MTMELATGDIVGVVVADVIHEAKVTLARDAGVSVVTASGRDLMVHCSQIVPPVEANP